ncbi:hypothetical protein DLAC_11049 [Tieghemostelium lacteum]|uniref:Threonylcarbamoyl-AMP synthase n=1 Tax=Tieghemostelium lacteum TaxID=361077 RepID=A0A151Z322_TIELA|nr:hypothetical protein DLAC_11049 [Tieghemostelium lacteum]|eukprot:KYQ88349.1 hypothetical protein DLAC_11049 [Tieghemostelium lacteum]
MISVRTILTISKQQTTKSINYLFNSNNYNIKYLNTRHNNFEIFINPLMEYTITTNNHSNNHSSAFNAKCKIVKPTIDNLKEAGRKIQQGGLVAFPTETVYGLGANALDKDAVLSIFTCKGRPLTDPVIVHIVDVEYAHTLLDLTDKQKEIFNILAQEYWPGPLTMVAKASQLIPMIVTANTGYVGVRYPRHVIAQSLIRDSGLPIAAPSANRFGHVSPTRALHVHDDLGHSPITIIDTDDSEHSHSQPPCEFGIESTVLKFKSDNELIILRKGGVSESSLRTTLSKISRDINLTTITKTVSMTTKENQEAPGQLITHYAPDIQTYILDQDTNTSNHNNSSTDSNNEIKQIIPIKDCIYIDFGGQLNNPTLKSQFLAYKDLSETSNILEAANQLFSLLRWSESISTAKVILLPDLKNSLHFKTFDHSEAVFDRIFRASSGKFATIDTINNNVLIK